LPIVNNTRVERLSHDGNMYEAETGNGVWRGRNVVVAMADFQDPRVPEFAPDLRTDIVQLHASQYKNPSQLQPGPVLVVGVGNSGADIALELSGLHHTYLAGKETAHIPFRIEGWFGRWVGGSLVRFLMTRILTISTPIGRAVRPKMEGKASPLVRVKPKDLVRAGVERVGRITGVKNGLKFAGKEPPLDVANVVWCTGYRPGFGWIDLPVFDSDGRPLQNRGVVESQPGLYFVGLFFLHNPWSENLAGMPADARHVVEQLIRRRTAEVPTLT
jgi:putative flavoprotein involved in K+ transport